MQKFITLMAAIAIIYLVVDYKRNEPTTKQDEIIAVAKSPKKENNDDSTNLEGNFLERYLSNILLNILKTPEGRTFLENLIQPIDKINTEDSSLYITRVHFPGPGLANTGSFK